MTFRSWALLVAAVAMTSPRSARADTEDDIASLVCGDATRPLAVAAAVGDPTYVIDIDGKLTPEVAPGNPGMQLAFRGFASPILVRIEVPTKTVPTRVACGWINPRAGHFTLPVEPPRGSILHIDVYMADERRGEIDAAQVFRSRPRRDSLAALGGLEFIELEARCRSNRSAVYLVHQEIAYAVGEVYPVRFDDAGEFDLVRTGQPLWLAVTNVPGNVTLRIVQKRGTEVAYSAESQVKTAVPPITRLVPDASFAMVAAAGDVTSCQPDATPLAERGTRIEELKPLDKHHVSRVAICDKAVCPADGDENIRGRVRLEPSPRGRWALLTELSFGVGVMGWHLADRAAVYGFDAQSEPAFVPILGARGPEQVFELRQRANPRNAITTSLLLARHVTDRWFVGLGPSLTIGTGGAALGQFGARIGRGIANSGVYVTVGASARFVAAPEFYAIGDRVTLAQSGDMMADTPGFASHTAVLFQAEIGLAVDLGTVVSGASAVISALGGTK